MVKFQVSDTDGVSKQGNYILLKSEGSELARAESHLTPEEAVSNLELLNLFPGMEFGFADHKELIRAKASVNHVDDDYIRGKLMVGDISGFWEASRAKSNFFNTSAPGRDYAKDRPGEGWEIRFPRFVLDMDPVLRFRVAVMIERMLYELAAGKMSLAGVSRQISNTFSHDDPIWLKLPLISKAT